MPDLKLYSYRTVRRFLRITKVILSLVLLVLRIVKLLFDLIR